MSQNDCKGIDQFKKSDKGTYIKGDGTPIYPVLRSSYSIKAKVKSQSRILVGQRSSIDFYCVDYIIVGIPAQN